MDPGKEHTSTSTGRRRGEDHPDCVVRLQPRAEPRARRQGIVSVGLVAEWMRDAVTDSAPQESLQAVIGVVLRAAPCAAASITMLHARQGLESVAFSGDLALRADHLQRTRDEGPAMDAVRASGIVHVPNLTRDQRWPSWAASVAELGVSAAMSLHLAPDPRGSLNLYFQRSGDYDDTDVETVRVIAAHTATLLATAQTARNLWKAIASRTVIGQAQGILMERYDLSPDTAFSVLRRHSQHHNIKLITLAGELTTTRELPGLPVVGSGTRASRNDSRESG